MKILKKGLPNTGSFCFTCDTCGCRYVADSDDYFYIDYVECLPVPSNTITDSEEIGCMCPNCGTMQKRYLYDKRTLLSEFMQLGFLSHIPCFLSLLVAVISVISIVTFILNGVGLFGVCCSVLMLILSVTISIGLIYKNYREILDDWHCK